VTVRDVIRRLRDDGWELVRQRGFSPPVQASHKPGLVTIAGHPGDDMAPGTFNSVLKLAGLR
jgi:predicted RNA binding protein YcfA (HicA-like mRNA interferase family)